MVTTAIGAPFRWVAAARRARAFHPDGVVCAGTARFCAPALGRLDLESHGVTVRLSKGAGTPGGLPDVAGMAIRMSVAGGDDPWDLLLASSLRQGVRTAIPVPAMSWATATFSSLTPFRTADELWWIRAEMTDAAHLTDLSDGALHRGWATTRSLTVVLSQARGPLGSFTPFGELTLTSVDEPAHIDFDPVRNLPTGVEMWPGWLARLRRSSYDNSRAGRPDTERA